MITPKDEFISKIMVLTCRNCSRKARIERRLRDELIDHEFDFERHDKVDKILTEE